MQTTGKPGKHIFMNTFFANRMPVPTSVGAFGYVLGAVCTEEGQCVMDT